MTSNEFLYHLLTGDYANMKLYEFKLLDKYDSIFKLGKKYHTMVMRLEKSFNNELVNEMATYIEAKIPLRFFILNRLDNYAIYEEDFRIDFKNAFHNNLERMDTLRLFYFIDRISRLNKKYKINFFGHRSNEPIAYHKINEVISQSFDLKLVFEYFGRGYPKRFEHLPIYRINREALIQVIKDYTKLYFPILEGVSEFYIDTKEEDLESKKALNMMNKKLKIYFDILSREHKVLSGDSKDNRKNWKYLIDGFEIDDSDFGEDLEFYDIG